MIGRGRVISLTPSGAHLGAGQELSDLPHPQPFQNSSANHGNLGTKTELSHCTFLYRETFHCQSRKANQDES